MGGGGNGAIQFRSIWCSTCIALYMDVHVRAHNARVRHRRVSSSGFWANFGIKSEEFRGFTPGACATEISPCLMGNFFPAP